MYNKKQAERDKERADAARVKEVNREERLAAINAQQQQHIKELQRKIQQKVRRVMEGWALRVTYSRMC